MLVLWSLYQLYLGFFVRTWSIYEFGMYLVWGWGLRVHVMRRV